MFSKNIGRYIIANVVILSKSPYIEASKSAYQLPHHNGRRSRAGGAPCISELKGAAEITSIVGTLFLIPDSPNLGNMNQQGWLPPCRPCGLRWQGQLNGYTHTRRISTPHLQPPTQASIPTSHPKPAGIIEKRLPPHTTMAGGAYRGGGRKAKEVNEHPDAFYADASSVRIRLYTCSSKFCPAIF